MMKFRDGLSYGTGERFVEVFNERDSLIFKFLYLIDEESEEISECWIESCAVKDYMDFTYILDKIFEDFLESDFIEGEWRAAYEEVWR